MAKAGGKAERRKEQQAKQRQVEVTKLQEERRRRAVKYGGGVLAVIALVVAVAAGVSLQGKAAGPSTAVAAGLGPQTNNIPSGTGQFHSGAQVLHIGNKPELLFIGAQYCPFCAAERWAIVKSLDQFGHWSGLTSSTNTQGESGFGLIPTFDLLHANYSSKYVGFDSKDVEDRDFKPLQKLSPAETEVFNRYDSSGGIPLVVAGGYSMTGAGYSPGVIDGKSFKAVQSSLQSGSHTSYVADINSESNMITALLCHAGRNRPAAVCGRGPIQRLVRRLK
ncbi:MAG: DUF929 family protein [Chloroflexota bacterium]